jgi:hypothetical protein
MPNESDWPQNVADKVETALNAVAVELRGKGATNKPWTAAIKKQLEDGKPSDCEACATGYGYHSAEFLYDLIWIRRDNGTIRDVIMVLECEWGIGQEIYDFQKLLLARANLRVMVFQGNSAQREQLIPQMKNQIDRFEKTQLGDLYLFACWDMGHTNANHRKFHYE